MKRHAKMLLAALILCSGCSPSGPLTPGDFTREFAETLRHQRPGLIVSIEKDLELKITDAGGQEATSFLDNAYSTYQQDPKGKTAVIQRFVTAYLEGAGKLEQKVDRTHIVPVVKDRAWLEETRQVLLDRGAKQILEKVYDDLNPDLVILYAEDSPGKIRYLTPADLGPAKVERAELRALACANLKRLLPKIEKEGDNGLYMVTAGGDYESSLLLLDSIWTGGQMKVQGEIVVAIPTRDLLLVTGSEDVQGLKKVRQITKDAWNTGPYKLTEKLFVYRNGKFEEFK